jgi:hypothetical protein
MLEPLESPISYKHVNFCGVHRPCEQSYNKEDYCVHHANEETRMWYKDIGEIGKKVCELYPFLCKHCDDIGHFNFQCSSPNSEGFRSIVNQKISYATNKKAKI